MRTLLTFGVYDLLHIGHIALFKRIKELFPNEKCRLIVAVQDGDSILKYKPNANVVYSTHERLFMVSSLRWVDDVIVYSDVDCDIKSIDFDVFVKGPDQNHNGFQNAIEWCLQNDKEVIELPRTDGVSSSELKLKLGL